MFWYMVDEDNDYDMSSQIFVLNGISVDFQQILMEHQNVTAYRKVYGTPITIDGFFGDWAPYSEMMRSGNPNTTANPSSQIQLHFRIDPSLTLCVPRLTG